MCPTEISVECEGQHPFELVFGRISGRAESSIALYFFDKTELGAKKKEDISRALRGNFNIASQGYGSSHLFQFSYESSPSKIEIKTNDIALMWDLLKADLSDQIVKLVGENEALKPWLVIQETSCVVNPGVEPDKASPTAVVGSSAQFPDCFSLQRK
jgi:hypothetical protein